MEVHTVQDFKSALFFTTLVKRQAREEEREGWAATRVEALQ